LPANNARLQSWEVAFMRVGIEVGGTFTDLVAIGADGLRLTKVPSVRRAPDEGAFQALIASGIAIGSIEDLVHGSTVATNAVLERKGSLTAFVTTEGFRDILALQRHGRSRIYDLEYQKPKPVVRRAASFEVVERILADGTVATPLDTSDFGRRLLPALEAGAFEAVAICLLNAFANPIHERRLRDLLAEARPDLNVTISSDITREFREFERASTTTLSAYVQPVIDKYIARFRQRLDRAGFRGRFSVMQSNGGRLPAEAMRANAINALLSGPAAGVVGAVRQAGRSGYGNLITLDIGGTSTDVCVVRSGVPQVTQEFQIDGLPIRIPLLDIHTIGAGGGSVIWVDEGNMLRVGPHSAGAEPGPACYGRGGSEPTLTDAHIVRGTIRPEVFLGGRMQIDAAAAASALKPIARRFGLSLEAAADSAVALADASIVRAIQLISTERGHDPRDYVLVPYGGAGPLHAARVAEELGIGRIVVPPAAGIISAYGLIASDFVLFESMTHRRIADASAAVVLREVFQSMRGRAIERAAASGLAGQLVLNLTAEMRFVGQAFEVPVLFEEGELETLASGDVRRRFAEAHQRVYFFGGEAARPIEFVSFRLGVVLPLDQLPLLRQRQTMATEAPARQIRIFDGKAWQDAHLIGCLQKVMCGPALIEDPTSTLYLPSGWTARLDAHDNTILERR
jgi:N-methylhydantoinase A